MLHSGVKFEAGLGYWLAEGGESLGFIGVIRRTLAGQASMADVLDENGEPQVFASFEEAVEEERIASGS